MGHLWATHGLKLRNAVAVVVRRTCTGSRLDFTTRPQNGRTATYVGGFSGAHNTINDAFSDAKIAPIASADPIYWPNQPRAALIASI